MVNTVMVADTRGGKDAASDGTGKEDDVADDVDVAEEVGGVAVEVGRAKEVGGVVINELGEVVLLEGRGGRS